MSLKLHQSAYEYAQKLITNRRCVLDQRSDWTDHKPSRSAEHRFIEAHGFAAFGKWHLGEDDEEAEGSKCAVSSAESRAGQYKHTDIELAAGHLRGILDALMAAKRSSEREHVSSA
jgi:hypothetical protein